MKGTEDRRILRTRKKLKKALIELMEVKELQQLTITEVTKHADCNRVTFYSHYKDLNELLAAVIEEHLDGLVSNFRKSFQDLQRPSSTNVQRYLTIFEYIYAHQFIFRLIIKGEVLSGSQNQFCESLVHVAATELRLEEESDLEMPALNYFMTYGSLGFFLYWIKRDFKDSPEIMAGKLAALHGKMYGGVVAVEEKRP